MSLPACAFIPASVAQAALAQPVSSAPPGKSHPEPLKSESAAQGVPINILIDRNVAKGENEVEVHRHEADLWIGIDGEVHFEVGGTLVDARFHVSSKDGAVKENELKARDIESGMSYTLRAGDILYIPAGQPHRHWTDENGGGRLWIIKIPAAEIVPLDAVPGWQGSN